MSHLDSDFYDYEKDDEIGLEPRLTEYLKKKKFYQKNGIEADDLEKEYDITKKDMMRIRSHLRGDKKMYNERQHEDYIDPSLAEFPSAEFKKDPRFDRIKIKQKRDSDAQNQRHNYGIISKGYDMYKNDRSFAPASGNNDFRKGGFHPSEWMNEKSEKSDSEDDWNENVAKFVQSKSTSRSFHKGNTYENPRSKYNGYLSDRSLVNHDKYSVDAMIGKLDSYRHKTSGSFRNTNDMDYEHKRVLPNGRCNEKREYENNYQAVPHMEAGSLSRDIDVDTYMRFGTTPSRAGKSLGYPNPVEHYFDYISDDIQQPDHTVFERGIPSRAFNKDVARPMMKRDIMK